MRKIKEIARLRFAAGRTYTEIAAAVRVARSTVQTAVSRLKRACIRLNRGRNRLLCRYRTLRRCAASYRVKG